MSSFGARQSESDTHRHFIAILTAMIVEQLRKMVITELDMADDELPLVVSYGDHGFRKVEAEITEAEQAKDGSLYEYFSDADMNPGSKKVRVLLFQ